MPGQVTSVSDASIESTSTADFDAIDTFVVETEEVTIKIKLDRAEHIAEECRYERGALRRVLRLVRGLHEAVLQTLKEKEGVSASDEMKAKASVVDMLRVKFPHSLASKSSDDTYSIEQLVAQPICSVEEAVRELRAVRDMHYIPEYMRDWVMGLTDTSSLYRTVHMCAGIQKALEEMMDVVQERLAGAVETISSVDRATEEVLKEDDRGFSLSYIKHLGLHDMYKKAQACFWTMEEIDLMGDSKDYSKLSKGEQFFINMILAFFAGSDGIVNQNIQDNFGSEVQLMEACRFYRLQMAMEDIHSETYAQLINSYVSDPSLKHILFQAIAEIPSIKMKAQWAMDWMDSRYATFAERLVAFAAVEGIFFSGAFCSIYWMKKRGLMPGLCFSNELISRDEGMHCDFACMLYASLTRKLSVDRVQEIIKEAVEHETEFICHALPVELIGMNSRSMTQYIQFVADRLLVELGCPKVWGVPCPFTWMELISLEGKANFFEKRVGEYSKSGVGASAEDNVFTLDAEGW